MATKGKKKTPESGKAHTVRLSSKSGPKVSGKSFRLDQPLPVAAVAKVSPDIPRPAKTRYPIDLETFIELKEKSIAAKPLPLRLANVVRDSAKKRTEVGMMAAAPVALSAGPTIAVVPTASFAGLPFNKWKPFDCTLAVGPNHVLASVNMLVGVIDKTSGAVVVQRDLAAWFGNVVDQAETKVFDPKAIYDQFAGRWVLIAAAIARDPDRSWYLLSVSNSSDPTGEWSNYALDSSKEGATPTNNWADFPQLGLDTNALYITGNMFRWDGGFQYAKVRVIPKKALYSGGPVTYSDFARLQNADGSPAFTVQPCHTFGSPGVEYLVSTYFADKATNRNAVSLWTISNALGSPKMTLTTVKTDPYALPPDATQKDGGTPLMTNDARMLSAVFNGGSIWCAFTTRHVWDKPPNTAAIQWLQINPTGTVVQQGVFGAPGSNYYYPALMPDTHGNMVMVFSRSGPSEYVSVYFTGRSATDDPGMLQPSTLLKAGIVNYVRLDDQGKNRWGDYAGIGLDPSDSRTVYFYHGFAQKTDEWGSWIGAAKF